MRVVIVIDCDEDNEVIQHLAVVKKQLKAAILKRRKENESQTVSNQMDIDVSDSNCYGSHKAIVHFDDDIAGHYHLDQTYVP